MTKLTEEAKAIATEALKQEHPSLIAALVAALADLTVVATGRTADAGSYKYDYADLGDVVKLTRPVLARHGLAYITPVHAHGDGLACSVVFLHESGERFDCEPLPFPHGRDAQATGSAITYHRRYALVAALGMAAGDDDDGAKAAPRTSSDRAEPTPGNGAPTCARCGQSLAGAKVKPGDGGFVHKDGCTPEAPAASVPAPSLPLEEPAGV